MAARTRSREDKMATRRVKTSSRAIREPTWRPMARWWPQPKGVRANPEMAVRRVTTDHVRGKSRPGAWRLGVPTWKGNLPTLSRAREWREQRWLGSRTASLSMNGRTFKGYIEQRIEDSRFLPRSRTRSNVPQVRESVCLRDGTALN